MTLQSPFLIFGPFELAWTTFGTGGAAGSIFHNFRGAGGGAGLDILYFDFLSLCQSKAPLMECNVSINFLQSITGEPAAPDTSTFCVI